jgi:hypothetical protein
MAISKSSVLTFIVCVSMFFPHKLYAAYYDIADCVQRVGLGEYNYDVVDIYGRLGPYQLTVRDLFSAGVCTGTYQNIGVVNDWKQCDFKGFAAEANYIDQLEMLKDSEGLQERYFKVIVSQLRKKYSDIMKLDNLDGYKSYVASDKMLYAALYRKGYKAMEFYSLFAKDVVDTKAGSFLRQLEDIKRCQIFKNRYSKPAINDWQDAVIIQDKSKLERFQWKKPTEDVVKTLQSFFFSQPDLKNSLSSDFDFASSVPGYTYDKLDIDLDGAEDYIIQRSNDDPMGGWRSQYVVFLKNGNKVLPFSAGNLYYTENMLVIDGYGYVQ